MSTIIVMPQLGESVAEGIIGKWLKSEGEAIAKDEPIVEIITDKVNAEIPSPVAGVLERITQPEGATVAVGEEIAVVGDGSGRVEARPESQVRDQVPESAARTSPSGSTGMAEGALSSAGSDPQSTPSRVGVDLHGDGEGRRERVRSSPLVRRLAEEYGISLAEVPGTGIGGRVSKQDILSYVEQRLAQPAFEQPTAEPAIAGAPAIEPYLQATQLSTAPPREDAGPAERELRPNEERVPVTPLRKIIAARMTQSIYTLPHATTTMEVDMSQVVRHREANKTQFQQRESISLSYVAYVIKATVDALKQFPIVNAEWAGDSIIMKRDININVAVDAPDGLTTPVIHHADERSLAGLSRAIHDLAMRGRARKLTVADMQGGTFTVNNTGALGSVEAVSIINYPQAGILSANAIVKRPVVLEQDGQDVIAVRSMMNLSFSFDHRLLDGGTAAAFVNAVKARLESFGMDYPVY